MMQSAAHQAGCGAGTAGCGDVPAAPASPGNFGAVPMLAPMVQATDAGGPEAPANCAPGLYVGTFSCNSGFTGADESASVPLEGDVSFTLAVNTKKVEQGPCQEFCQDLVITESSSVLNGLVGVLAFTANLTGGLDCRTNVFQASVPNGKYGLPEPVDPNKVDGAYKVLEPPIGVFTGTLVGKYENKSPQEIGGAWELKDPSLDYGCNGPFEVRWTAPAPPSMP